MSQERVARVILEKLLASKLGRARPELQYLALNKLNNELAHWKFTFELMGYEVKFDARKQHFISNSKVVETVLNKLLIVGRALAIDELSDLAQLAMVMPEKEREKKLVGGYKI